MGFSFFCTVGLRHFDFTFHFLPLLPGFHHHHHHHHATDNFFLFPFHGIFPNYISNISNFLLLMKYGQFPSHGKCAKVSVKATHGLGTVLRPYDSVEPCLEVLRSSPRYKHRILKRKKKNSTRIFSSR